MNEQKNNGRGIFYGVIGVATLVVAIIGATFAYFTATASNNIITGNMATVSLGLAVEKVTTADVTQGGMIPMSNSMVEASVNNASNAVCVDDNGNAVCQVYKITLTNSSSAAQFVDGYVALRGGSGEPTDLPTTPTTYSYVDGAKVDANLGTTTYGTTMRWAQVFAGNGKDAAVGDYTTKGTQDLGATSDPSFDAIGSTSSAKNDANIRTTYKTLTEDSARGTLTSVTISGNSYDAIGTNYIRLSNHAWKTAGSTESYDRTADITSALVFNQSVAAGRTAEYYIVVWLSETGTNQTAGATVGEGGSAITNPAAASFFAGNVTFVSAQGSEVSATFAGYAKVQSDKVQSDKVTTG